MDLSFSECFCCNQDEYEELLRHAVVTPKFDPSTPSQLLQMSQFSGTGQISHLMEGRHSQPTEGGSSVEHMNVND